MCVYFFTTTTTTAVLVFHTYMASSGNTHKAHYSYIPIFSVVTCNCNGDVIRCRRPMITYCNRLRRFLSDCHQTVLQSLPWSLSPSKRRILQHAKENIYNTLKLILHDSSMVGCFSFFFAWLEYENSLYADTLTGTS